MGLSSSHPISNQCKPLCSCFCHVLDGFEAIINSINYLSGIISTKLLIYWPYLLKLKFEGFKKQKYKKKIQKFINENHKKIQTYLLIKPLATSRQ